MNSNLKSKQNTMPILILYSSRSTLKFLLSFGIYPVGMLLNGGAYFTFCLSIQMNLCGVCFVTVLILCFSCVSLQFGIDVTIFLPSCSYYLFSLLLLAAEQDLLWIKEMYMPQYWAMHCVHTFSYLPFPLPTFQVSPTLGTCVYGNEYKYHPTDIK